jgi:hypothetical protein
MLLAEELPLSRADLRLLDVAHCADGATEIQHERIAAYQERRVPGEASGMRRRLPDDPLRSDD